MALSTRGELNAERTAATSAPEQPRPGTRGATGPKEWTMALGAAALASGIAVWVLQLWRANLRIPLVYKSDGVFELMSIKEVLDFGWDLTNPRLAAPFGQESYDFPAHGDDTLHLLIVKALGVFSHDAALVMNVYFLLCFPVIAVVTYLVLRRLEISASVAVVIAVLFTLLPAHFDNGEIHIFLGAYFTVPISCYLVLVQLRGGELFGRDVRRGGLRAYATRGSAAMVAVCVLLGSAGNYYALFTAALLAMASVLVFLGTRRPRPFLCGLVATIAIVGVVALNGLPTLIYVAQHGRDTQVAHREAAETDAYGLALTQLVLPIESHRIPALASATRNYLSTAPVPVTGETSFDTLGVISVLGLLYATISLFAACAGGPGYARLLDRRAARAALAAGLAFLIGTVGGLATLFAYLVNPQLRAPNRIAIFIAFFALYGAALALERLWRALQGPRRRLIFAAALACALSIGALDQTSPAMIPSYRELAAQYTSDGSFVRAIEHRVGADAEIFQLPMIEFPEGAGPPSDGWVDAVGYLHSSHLRWSYGAMIGRASDWQAALAGRPLRSLLEGVTAAGFAGVSFDALELHEGEAEIAALTRELGVQPLVSEDGQLYFFDLAPYRQSLRRRYTPSQLASLAQVTLHPGV